MTYKIKKGHDLKTRSWPFFYRFFARVKVTRKKASGGQEINPLDPRYVSMTGQRPVMLTIKTCLATFGKRLAPGRATGGYTFTALVFYNLWLKWA